MKDKEKTLKKREAEMPAGIERTRNRPVFTPPVDIYTREGGTVLVADMPGVDENSVEVHLEQGVLTINGRIPEPEIPADYRLIYSEYRNGDYHRCFKLSEAINNDKIEATLKNGTLKLFLPEAEEVQPRKISVQSG